VKPFLQVRQIGSTIGKDPHQRKVVKGLGLRGPGSHVVVANTPSFRGMIKQVLHLLDVQEIDAPASAQK
jgi:large subunit ribosomal protein L30